MRKLFSVFMILLLTAILIPGCDATTSTPTTSASSGETLSSSDLPDGMGKLVVNVTDPPPPEMESVMVEVGKLEVHKAGGSWTTVAENMEPFDLISLEDRVELLATAIVDSGIYTQIRLDIISVTIWVEGEDHTAKVPSGKIKLVGSFEVIVDGETEVTLDFVGAESVMVTGKGEYVFKPVVKLLTPQTPEPGDEENEAPVVGDQSFSLDENSANGTVVGTVSATDPDPGDSLAYAITEGNISGAFAIDSNTGSITVADVSQLDYEATPSFSLTVQVTDTGSLTDTAMITVDLIDISGA